MNPQDGHMDCQSGINSPFENCSSQKLYVNETTSFDIRALNFSDFQNLWYRKDAVDILFRVAFVVPIVLLGVIGNMTIIYSMCKFKLFRTKPTNIFILNMATADLLTTLVCPMAALFTDIYQFYVLGSFICRIEGFVKITCLLVKSYSLIVLSWDWLLCVVKPCRTKITIKQSWLAMTTIWFLSISMASPLFMWRKLRRRQWRDLVEVWCCELIQYSKYFWVVINLFLVYLPTFFMTIVLIIILVKMDKFEAKLKKSRTDSNQSNVSLSISMKYRRRIVKILITYLLSSFICWTPLQFIIIYRHFRSDPIPAPWFFELTFFAQLCASLTAALNPIIFGFLSQPFRRVLARFVMFKFLDKILRTNTKTSENMNPDLNAHHMNQGNLNISRKQRRDSQRIPPIQIFSKPQLATISRNSKISPRNQIALPSSIPRDTNKDLTMTHGVGEADIVEAGPSQLIDGKRVPFEGSAMHQLASSDAKSRAFDNVAFIQTDNSVTKFDKVINRGNMLSSSITQQMPTQPAKPTSTTSFMLRHYQSFRAPSAVSMDSINIEENIEQVGESTDNMQRTERG